MQPSSPAPWELIHSETGPEIPIFKVNFRFMKNPRNGRSFKRLVLETHDWVNVVALTPEQELVVVEQYRSGKDAITVEIPGGVVEPGEEHFLAAERELAEETGFTAGAWIYLGAVEVNPAIQNNLCHHWLAKDVQRTKSLSLDPGEDIAIRTIPASEVLEEIRSGAIRHSLALSALSRVFDIRPAFQDTAR